MDLLIVVTEDLTRVAGSLAWVLRTAHRVEVWNDAELERRAAEVRGRPTIIIGAGALARATVPVVKVRYHRHGVLWGFAGHRAVITVDDLSGDADAVIGAVDAELSALTDDARTALTDLGADPPAASYRGIHLAGAFLNPMVHVPEHTTRSAAWVNFPVERLLWERQYVLAIGTFLRSGFDAFCAPG